MLRKHKVQSWLQDVPLEIHKKNKSRMGIGVSMAHNLRKYVANKAKIREKCAQYMIMVVEKPVMKVAG